MVPTLSMEGSKGRMLCTAPSVTVYFLSQHPSLTTRLARFSAQLLLLHRLTVLSIIMALEIKKKEKKLFYPHNVLIF